MFSKPAEVGRPFSYYGSLGMLINKRIHINIECSTHYEKINSVRKKHDNKTLRQSFSYTDNGYLSRTTNIFTVFMA